MGRPAFGRIPQDFPYPRPGRVLFYFIGFDGIRRIDADEESLMQGKDRRSDLWNSGQRVLSELQRIPEKGDPIR